MAVKPFAVAFTLRPPPATVTAMAAVVADVERIVCELPFTERQARITEREVYTWNVVELCKVTLSTGEIGWGETVL